MKKFVLIGAALALTVSAQSFGQDKKDSKKKEAAKGHCEKLEADGKTVDVEAKDKADCKAKGGKWNKASSDHSHGG